MTCPFLLVWLKSKQKTAANGQVFAIEAAFADLYRAGR